MCESCHYVEIVMGSNGEKCYIHYIIKKEGDFFELYHEGDEKTYQEYLKVSED